jgi:hypothetical protein
MKFRKKPVVIEATQWWKMGDHPAVVETPEWVVGGGHPRGWVETLEGGHIVTPGDWIITGVQGEHYPCKPDIFEMTYEVNEMEPTPMEKAFWEYAEPYTGMQGIDMEKSSHGRAFMAGWEAALKYARERVSETQMS